TTHYAYDTVGRLSSVTTPGGEVVGYSYNGAGQRSTLTYPDRKQVEYGYDQVGRLDTVTDWASREVSYSYDDAGRLTGVELPNSTSSSLSYDDANRLAQINHTSEISGTIESIDYQLDSVGNRMVMTDTSGTTSYTYDDLYRLTGVTYPDSSSTSYEYDPVGNRTVMTTSLGTTDYSYDNDDRMTTAGSDSYTWDNNGNMRSKTSGGVTTDYTYDYADRLTEIADGTNTYQYTYNGDGIRVRKNVNGTSTDYIWDLGLGLPVVLTDTNSIYLYGLDLIAQQQGEDVSYYHADGLGSVRNLTNSSGQIVGGYTYDVFGAVSSSSGTVSNDFQFAGEQLDETGLVYLRARYYDPSTGRFITKDPFNGLIQDPRTLHHYVYGGHNPATITDPSGKLFNLALGVVGGLVGGAIAWYQAYSSGADTGTILTAAGIGGLTGASAGLGFGLFGSKLAGNVAVGAVSGGAGNLATQILVQKRSWNQVDWGSVVVSGVSGAVGSFGGYGVGKWVGSQWTWSYSLGRIGTLSSEDIANALASGAFGFGADVSFQWLLTSARHYNWSPRSKQGYPAYNRMQPCR
ncbi:MAG: hypothetical protein M1319_02690, partial [Chloroflexi bacterium]|nr:hypothetical protein [Chloroflexota bacterium]